LCRQLDKYWGDLPGYSERYKTTLHYIEGQLHIDLYIPQSFAKGEAHELLAAYQNRVKVLKEIGKITLHFVCENSAL
jgi:hypothetical protein